MLRTFEEKQFKTCGRTFAAPCSTTWDTTFRARTLPVPVLFATVPDPDPLDINL